MSLFDDSDLVVCPRCRGMGTVYDPKVDADKPCPVCGGGPPEPPAPAPAADDDYPTFDDLPVEEEPSGHVGPSPEATIREAFLRFHSDNPHVYDELVLLAKRAKRAGNDRIGIGMLFEVLRWRHALRTGGDDFKLNNNYRSYYSRLIMFREPELGHIFELRKLHGRGLAESDAA